MANLILDSTQSLRGVNEWISYIDSNIEGTKRVAYKGTRPSISDGASRIGDAGQLGLPKMPQPSLVITSTSLDWSQGEIFPSESNVHFAINGRGFFIVVDSYGQPYLTRDGEFHWTQDGYLVTSQGLRVVGKGQNLIKRGELDLSDDFTPEGESVDFVTYGNKTFMMVDVGNLDGLRFSQYGSTTYLVDGLLPFSIENNFSRTMDGLNPYYTVVPGTASFGLNTVTKQVNGLVGNARALVGDAMPINNFFASVNLQIPGALNTDWIGLMFGQKKTSDDYTGPNVSGYNVQLYNNAGVWQVRLIDNINPAIPIATAALGAINPSAAMVTLTVNVVKGKVDISVNNTVFLTGTISDNHNGYASLRHVNTSVGLPPPPLVPPPASYDDLLLNPYRDYTTERTAQFWGWNEYKRVGVIGDERDVAYFRPASCAKDLNSVVVRQALESSNTTITEYIPLLSLAQKMFTAISKIISVYSSMQDDLHATFR